MNDEVEKQPVNFQMLTLVLIMFLYVLIIIVMLEIVYFEKSINELIEVVNLLVGG